MATIFDMSLFENKEEEKRKEEEEREKEEEERKKELQNEFLEVVEKMKMQNVEFPNEFKLYYVVMQHNDRKGTIIKVTPYLTEEHAEMNKYGSSSCSDGKYDWYSQSYSVVDSSNEPCTENYTDYDVPNEFSAKCEINT